MAAGDASPLDDSRQYYGRFFQSAASAGDDNRARWVHYAARWCRVDLLSYLVQVCGLPANKPSAQSRVGASPSHDAAAVGNTETLRWLLEHTDSHISDVDDTGATVVHLAARYGHLRMLKWLVTEVDGGREATHAQTLSRALPLHLAAMNGHLDVVKFIVEHGAM
ncbi:hypothetical protein NP493_143g02034 [Ridgeia piscesae]|uniref:Uncharacterized protein n=1 Tax=Ridgeia piscesae TaxID=27915 RepID=A0AAD9P4R9_RIDPI|nr:hypothetical protein NP493_143g02034 [Ridgeia piscesae]